MDSQTTTHQPAPLRIDQPIRILVDRRRALGDVIMITPVLRELRRRYGQLAFIQVVTDEVNALKNNPHVSKVVMPTELTASDQWDLYVNLNDAYEVNVTSHYVDAYLYRAFGNDIAGIDRSLALAATEDEKAAVELIKKQIGGKYIVVHMRRWAWESKNISADTWSQLVAWLGSAHPGIKIVSIGAGHDLRVPSDQPARFVDLNDRLSLGELHHLIAGAAAFVGGDSAPYHIACATSTPIVALLSHIAPKQILPWRDGIFGKDVHVVQPNVACVGCYARQATPVRQIICENTDQWACSRSFDCGKITRALGGILTAPSSFK